MIALRTTTICLIMLIGFASLLASLSLPLNIPPARAAQAAATCSTMYWGRYVAREAYGFSDPPWDTRAMDAFEANTKKKMAIFHWGQQWMNSNGTMAAFPTNYFDSVRNRGYIPLLNWLSMKAGAGNVNQPDFQLSDIY